MAGGGAQSLQSLLRRLCVQMESPSQSFHAILMRSCTQMEEPPQSFRWLPCWRLCSYFIHEVECRSAAERFGSLPNPRKRSVEFRSHSRLKPVFIDQNLIGAPRPHSQGCFQSSEAVLVYFIRGSFSTQTRPTLKLLLSGNRACAPRNVIRGDPTWKSEH